MNLRQMEKFAADDASPHTPTESNAKRNLSSAFSEMSQVEAESQPPVAAEAVPAPQVVVADGVAPIEPQQEALVPFGYDEVVANIDILSTDPDIIDNYDIGFNDETEEFSVFGPEATMSQVDRILNASLLATSDYRKRAYSAVAAFMDASYKIRQIAEEADLAMNVNPKKRARADEKNGNN